MKKALTGSDLFCLFQIVMAYYFAIPQALGMMKSVQGVTITWLLCAHVFILLNLALTWSTWRNKATRKRSTTQALAIYGNWAVLLVPMVGITFWKCHWTKTDTVVTIGITIATVAAVLWGKATKRSLRDPILRGVLVGIFRVVPHFYLSYVIIDAGSSAGIKGHTVFAANITATARIIHLYLSGRKVGWDSGGRASFLSELANEGSWLIVTVIWFLFW